MTRYRIRVNDKRDTPAPETISGFLSVAYVKNVSDVDHKNNTALADITDDNLAEMKTWNLPRRGMISFEAI
jgi:hypothetical protein